MPNRLVGETSPYLLQHANNPVDWYPWGEEALAKSRDEQLPIFLSIGYSACHWCHVMEHESFEDDTIARMLNARFVPVKVDREERPDLDQIYMTAVQILSGRGGWPMSMFLTPELKPFFGGTYWPPRDRMGMPGFLRVLEAVDDAWQNRRDQAVQQSSEIAARIAEISAVGPTSELAPEQLLRGAVAQFERSFDSIHGGFGGAPKFPQPMNLQILLRAWKRWPREEILNMVCLTLDKMARGGIYDHLAGGFARYSVDERWLVPHFEKMLYDNALLVDACSDAFLATGETRYARVMRETLGYVLNYMTDDLGAFHSTEDADSEGQEGKFYLWTSEEIDAALGSRAARFREVYDVTDDGNFEGKNILNMPRSLEQCASLKGWNVAELATEMAECREALLRIRDQRVRPGKDDKIIVSWNGLMIHALARASVVLQRPEYLNAAVKAADFIRRHMMDDRGRLKHVWRQGRAKFNGFLDDYACYGNALVTLYEAGFDESWIDVATRLADVIMGRFRDRERDGFYYTSDDHEALIARTKDQQDNAIPSGSAMAATFLLRLGKLNGRRDYSSAAQFAIRNASGILEQAPAAAGQMLMALDFDLGPTPEIVVIGDPETDETRDVLNDLNRRFLPNRVLACRARPDREDGSAELDPIFLGRFPEPGSAISVYACEAFTCDAPVHGVQPSMELWDRLEQRARSGSTIHE